MEGLDEPDSFFHRTGIVDYRSGIARSGFVANKKRTRRGIAPGAFFLIPVIWGFPQIITLLYNHFLQKQNQCLKSCHLNT